MYNRTYWVDHVTDQHGEVIQYGTLLDQEHSNNMERGISDIGLALALAQFKQTQDGYGRFNEIAGEGSCKYLRPVNAENFLQYKGTLEVGTEPRLGACMVWQKGATLTGSDGAGHVAIVEKVISATEIVTSESGWGASKPFWTQTRKKGSDGNWGQGQDTNS